MHVLLLSKWTLSDDGVLAVQLMTATGEAILVEIARDVEIGDALSFPQEFSDLNARITQTAANGNETAMRFSLLAGTVAAIDTRLAEHVAWAADRFRWLRARVNTLSEFAIRAFRTPEPEMKPEPAEDFAVRWAGSDVEV